MALIEDGARFQAGDVIDQVLEGYLVRLRGVSRTRREQLLAYSSSANRRRPFEALQLVLPDAEGRWPWNAAYDAYPQPLLAGR